MAREIAGLIRDLHAPDAKVRAHAINSLAHLGPNAADALPDLIALVDAADEDTARLALRAISFLGASTLTSVKPRIVEYAGDRRAAVRQMALCALRKMGAAASDCVALVAELVKDPDMGVQMQAMNALGNIASDADAAVAAVRHALRSEDPATRAEAEEVVRACFTGARSATEDAHDTAPSPEGVERPSVSLLSESDLRELIRTAERGRELLALDERDPEPRAIVAAAAEFIERARGELRRDRAELSTALGVLIGEQLRLSSNWNWVYLSTVEYTQVALTRPDHGLVFVPVQSVYEILGDPSRQNNICRLFELVVANVLPPSAPNDLLRIS